MRKHSIPKALVKLYVMTVIFFVLLIWTIWGNTALTVSNIKISSSRIPPVFSGRALKNILFFDFEFHMNIKIHQIFSFSGGFYNSDKILSISRNIFSYFCPISLIIRLRFTANMTIAPCISIPIRPDDDATS